MNVRRASMIYLILCFALILVVGTCWVAAAPSSRNASAICPDLSRGETVQDCPWAGVAHALIRDAESGLDVSARLSKLLPDLDAQLKADAKRQPWKNLWGQSINYDELAKGVIVHPEILKAIGKKLKIESPMQMLNTGIREEAANSLLPTLSATDPAGHQLVHAGMEHTYGYLFSVLKTAYGYKRARWVEGEIETGFGLNPGILGPRPAQGSLFANVTYFVGNIAFRDEPAKLTVLKKGSIGLPKSIRRFDFGSLKPIRLEETLEAKDSTGSTRKVVLRTDFVPFKAPQKNTHLLIYSVVDPSYGGSALITAFPVAQGFVDSAQKTEDLGEGKPVKTRYNAFVEGVTGHPHTGSRKVSP